MASWNRALLLPPGRAQTFGVALSVVRRDLCKVVRGVEILTTIAQLGLGVAGFSGIVIGFNRTPGRLNSVETYRVMTLFATSGGAIFLSLVPCALAYGGLSENHVCRVASALVALFGIVFLAVYLPATRQLLKEQPRLFHLPQLIVIIMGHLANVGVQTANAAAFFGERSLMVLILGLLWLLFHSIFQFARILFVQPHRD